jgi:hypothetical protein
MTDSHPSQDDPPLDSRRAAAPAVGDPDHAAVLRFAAELGRLIGRQLATDPTITGAPQRPCRRVGPRVP